VGPGNGFAYLQQFLRGDGHYHNVELHTDEGGPVDAEAVMRYIRHLTEAEWRLRERIRYFEHDFDELRAGCRPPSRRPAASSTSPVGSVSALRVTVPLLV
jgi:hypothetical protein